jgi:ABC-type lipoprotein export system ATPase subunit
VLISSHDEDVIRAADRVITLQDGRVVDDSYARL